jgi:hypothetical protein
LRTPSGRPPTGGHTGSGRPTEARSATR